MKFIRSTAFYLVISSLLIGCDDDEQRDPKIKTSDVTVNSASSFTAKGEIVDIGNIPIVDHGFVYSRQEYVTEYGASILSLGKSVAKGTFQANISITTSSDYGYYDYDSPIYLRAYLTNEKGTVYGEAKQITFPRLTLSAVVPQAAKPGDLITIIGSNFSTNPQDNLVKFNETPAIVRSATKTELKVEVPSNASSGYYSNYITITVRTGTQGVQYSNFQLLPSVNSFSPKSGSFGDLVIISGANFNSYSYTIFFGNISLSSSSVTSNSISFYVPTNVTNAVSKISLMANGNVIELPGEFTIIPPTISSISPTSSISGSLITISGSKFNPGSYYSSNNVVKFGEVTATLYSSSANEIKAYVPTGLTIGSSYDVTVSTQLHTATAPTKFTLVSPLLTDFSPKTASNNSYIMITGSNFGNVAGSVLFGNVSGYIYSWSNTSIQVQIPQSYSISAGSYKITVNAGGQSVSFDTNITIQ